MKCFETSAVDFSTDVSQWSTNPWSHLCVSGMLSGVPITTFEGRFMVSVHISQIIRNNRPQQASFITGV